MKPNRKTTWKTSSHYHLKKVFDDSELREDSVIRNFRITADDGKTYDTFSPIEFERFKNEIAITQMRTLLSDNNIKRLK